MTANIFGVALSTVSKLIHDVCDGACKHLGFKSVYLTRSEEEMIKGCKFWNKCGLTQAFGCINGKHVPVIRPFENSQDFTAKSFFSLNVQSVCNSRGLSMDVDCRWPESVLDAKVFCNSRINKRFQKDKIAITYQQTLPGCPKVGNYQIGDSAYSLTPYCMRE